MTLLTVAIGVTSLIVLPAAGLTWAVRLVWSLRQGRRLDRSKRAR